MRMKMSKHDVNIYDGETIYLIDFDNYEVVDVQSNNSDT